MKLNPKKILLYFVYVIFVFLVILFVLEIFVRKFVKIGYTFKTFNNKIYIHFIPNTTGIFYNTEKKAIKIHINKDGFRDVNWTTLNKKKYNIFFMGDSFVAGLQVPLSNTFVKLTKKYSKFKDKIECYNAGMTGTGTGQQLIYYTNIIYKYSPDALILFVDYNDLYDSNFQLTWKPYTPRWSLSNNNKLIFHKPKPNPILYLSGHLKLITLLFSIYKNFKLSSSYNKKIANIEYKQKFSGPIIFDDFFNLSPPKIIQNAYILEKILLQKFISYVKKNKTKFILVYLPADYQIEQAIKNKNKKFDFFLPSKFFKKVANEYKIPFIDLTPYILKEFKKQNMKWNWLHYKKDQHYNLNGHKFIAKIISKEFDHILQDDIAKKK